MHWQEIDSTLGTATLQPPAPVVADTPHDWQIVYTVGSRPLVCGAVIRFVIPYGFTPPQTAYATAVGFTAVSTSAAGVELALQLVDPKMAHRNHVTFGLCVFAEIIQGTLQSGDTVVLHYGKGNSAGLTNVGAFSRKFEGHAEFTVAVDAIGDRSAPHGGFRRLPPPQPTLEIRGGAATQLYVVVPSNAVPGEAFPVRITVRDRLDNTVRDFDRPLILSAADGRTWRYDLTAADAGHCRIPDVVLSSAGNHRFEARDIDHTISGRSGPCQCREADHGRSLFWGDIHVMTGISAGLGRPADAYRYARDYAHLDFCAVTDGDHADAYFTDAEWEETVAAVREFNEPGRYVTLLASECHERQVAGDKNIYYRDDQAPLLRWSDLEGPQPAAIWQALAGRRAMTIPHHTVSGTASLRPWDFHQPDFQRLVEIYSIWGSAEGEGCPRPNYWRNNYNNSVRAALAKGYRLGIIAAGDSHDGLAGNSSWMRLRPGYRNGLAAVYAPALTRDAIFDALWQRRCYGTTGARILLDFHLNDEPMGREISGGKGQARRLCAAAGGTAAITEFTVVRNGSEVYCQRGQGDEAVLDWTDDEPFDDICLVGYDGVPFVYYYVRVIQADGEIAWSSPIWILDSP